VSNGIVLPAAGEHKRLGQPKQLLPFRGRTLLRHAAETALTASLGPVITVLGAEEDRCRQALSGLPITIVVNPLFREGMGTSIATGARPLTDEHAAIITLCDQPDVTAVTLQALHNKHQQTSANIVAAQYQGTNGPPALFARAYFPRLRQLSGPAGAKALVSVDCREAALDLDTPADLARAVAHYSCTRPGGSLRRSAQCGSGR
jgi:molybdenum cofactor cytidylyltransferase